MRDCRTHKAVNFTNIIGGSKRYCEMIIQMYAQKSDTIFMAVCFGNVLGNNAGVISLFKRADCLRRIGEDCRSGKNLIRLSGYTLGVDIRIEYTGL